LVRNDDAAHIIDHLIAQRGMRLVVVAAKRFLEQYKASGATGGADADDCMTVVEAAMTVVYCTSYQHHLCPHIVSLGALDLAVPVLVLDTPSVRASQLALRILTNLSANSMLSVVRRHACS
jgi:hypothetical protein